MFTTGCTAPKSLAQLVLIFALVMTSSERVVAEKKPATNTENKADVIVYGSTPGGFCAAIAAAREGASVILLEPTDHIGGMSTGGLSHCDSNQMARATVMGLFDEWHTRVVRDYTDRGLPAPYDPATKDQSLWTFEPHVAMRVTQAMLDEAGVVVLTQRYLQSVTKDGPRITSLVTNTGTFSARAFVDGTYEGDLMAAAGVDWTIGRDISQTDILDEPHKDDAIAVSSFPIDSHDCQLFTVDQTQSLPDDANFMLVGNVQLESDVETVVSLNSSETVGFVVVDALQLVLTDQ